MAAADRYLAPDWFTRHVPVFGIEQEAL